MWTAKWRVKKVEYEESVSLLGERLVSFLFVSLRCKCIGKVLPQLGS